MVFLDKCLDGNLYFLTSEHLTSGRYDIYIKNGEIIGYPSKDQFNGLLEAIKDKEAPLARITTSYLNAKNREKYQLYGSIKTKLEQIIDILDTRSWQSAAR